MDKQKRIEEMARVLFDYRNAKNCCEEMDCSLFVEREFTCNECRNATILVNAGYRKIPEDAVVIEKSEYDKLRLLADECIDWRRKNCNINEICKEFTDKGVQNGN